MNAIVLDGNLKSALAIVRSLGTKGVTASVGAERKTGMALYSRYAGAQFVYPSPYTNEAGFIEAVTTEARRLGGKPVVYAQSDVTYLVLYKYREQLASCMTLLFPDSKSVEIAFDKAATYSLARVSGVPTITTHTPETREEVERLSKTLMYPCVIKTRKSVTWKQGMGMFGSATFIHTPEVLVTEFLELKAKLGEAPLIQDLLLGEEYGVEMLAREGKIYARVVHHRLRSLSPTGGASVLKETLEESPLRQTLERYAETLVVKLRWSGPIMVEFKVDSDSREPHLMEINGRFWGSLPLAIASGVDMPYLYFKEVTTGETPSPVVAGRAGVTSNHFFGGVLHLGRVLFARDAMRKFLYPSRMQALRDFFKLPKGTVSDVWSWRDPKPALMEIIDILKKI